MTSESLFPLEQTTADADQGYRPVPIPVAQTAGQGSVVGANDRGPAANAANNPVNSANSGMAAGRGLPADTAIVCLSHLRWDFVYQRPQHLMSRLARRGPVLYVEEPVPTDEVPHLHVRETPSGVRVVVPHLPAGECRPGDRLGEARQRVLLAQLLDRLGIVRPLLWYYTPMALGLTGLIEPHLVVFDCMDELAAFDNPPAELIERERRLLDDADLVFTGGHSLYESKRRHHDRVHLFPSSVDTAHFRRARERLPEPAAMQGLKRPRIGFYGVIDERFDLPLLAACAALKPDWEWVVVGPVVKIDAAKLPHAANLHYLGIRPYAELPALLSAWDVAMMPFAINASTRYISPTKTPEYLAAGRPVVSTPVPDVVRAYGNSGLVRIAGNAEGFVAAVQAALQDAGPRHAQFCTRADAMLEGLSWDRTTDEMTALASALPSRRRHSARSGPSVFAARVDRSRTPAVVRKTPAL